MTYFYLESSVAVRIVLGHSPSAAPWFDTATGDPEVSVISSRLLRTELTRVLRREGLPVRRRDALLDYIGLVSVSDALLAEAEAITSHADGFAGAKHLTARSTMRTLSQVNPK